MTRSLSRTLGPLGLVGALAISLAMAAPASAHNFIVSSTPAEGEVLTSLPEQWQVTTNETLLDLGGQGSGFALLVSDDRGLYYGDGCVSVQDENLSARAALGGDGDYVLTYQFISADGHTLSGEVPFSWQASAGFEPHLGLDDPPVCDETSSAPAPDPTATTEPEGEATDEPVTDAVPIEPISGNASPIVPIVIVVVVASVIGVLTAAIVRARARRPGEQPRGPEGTDL